jgi:hypothetical protein
MRLRIVARCCPRPCSVSPPEVGCPFSQSYPILKRGMWVVLLCTNKADELHHVGLANSGGIVGLWGRVSGAALCSPKLGEFQVSGSEHRVVPHHVSA